MTPFKMIYNDLTKVLNAKTDSEQNKLLIGCLGYMGVASAYVKLFETIGRLEDKNKELKETIKSQSAQIKKLTPKKVKK